MITDLKTLSIMSSAFVLAGLCILPGIRDLFPFWLIASGLNIAGTLFHELGHALTYWLYGHPSIPMIFTIFGADQAGGMAITWPRSWLMQSLALLLLFIACLWSRKFLPGLFVPSLLFFLLVLLTSWTQLAEVIPIFMGHGGAMLVGGFFLFRAWIYLDARNDYERWLNALVGAFLVLDNTYFCYKLFTDSKMLDHYSSHVAFGTTHNDFMLMTQIVNDWTTSGIAMFGFVFGLSVLVGSLVIAHVMRHSFFENPI